MTGNMRFGAKRRRGRGRRWRWRRSRVIIVLPRDQCESTENTVDVSLFTLVHNLSLPAPPLPLHLLAHFLFTLSPCFLLFHSIFLLHPPFLPSVCFLSVYLSPSSLSSFLSFLSVSPVVCSVSLLFLTPSLPAHYPDISLSTFSTCSSCILAPQAFLSLSVLICDPICKQDYKLTITEQRSCIHLGSVFACNRGKRGLQPGWEISTVPLLEGLPAAGVSVNSLQQLWQFVSLHL